MIDLRFRSVFWDTLLFGMETGMQYIFHIKDDRRRYDDFILTQGRDPEFRYSFYTNGPIFRKTFAYIIPIFKKNCGFCKFA